MVKVMPDILVREKYVQYSFILWHLQRQTWGRGVCVCVCVDF
jgi:hypothetical protein